jgi:hypothetical protein
MSNTLTGPADTLITHLRSDLPIEDLEKWEQSAKHTVATMAQSIEAPGVALSIARLVQSIGFLAKRKPYAMKASHLLGYSIFLQEPGQGFSFQRHLTHKVEVFHVIEAHAGALAFLCPFQEWLQLYTPERLREWLRGGEDRDFERFATRPQRGDVYRIDKPGLVHTIMGCYVQEFANTSLDMVDRLYDQNQGVSVPAHFGRSYMTARLNELTLPETSFLVSSDGTRSVVPVEETGDGWVRRLAVSPIDARLCRLPPKGGMPLAFSESLAIAVHVWRGGLRLAIGAASSGDGDLDEIDLAAGEVTLIAPGCRFRLTNAGSSLAEWSEEHLALDEAFA